MNRLILSAFTFTLALGFSACTRTPPPRMNPAPGPRSVDPGTAYLNEGRSDEGAPVEKKKHDEVVDPTPAARNEKIPPAPTPNNPEYAVKVDGKPGYVKSPYDTQGRMIDVRGLPPGTEAECPYTRRTFLVPP
jgi:hypothetical protein